MLFQPLYQPHPWLSNKARGDEGDVLEVTNAQFAEKRNNKTNLLKPVKNVDRVGE